MKTHLAFRGVDCESLDRLIQGWELAHVEFKSRRFMQPPDEDHTELAAALSSLANVEIVRAKVGRLEAVPRVEIRIRSTRRRLMRTSRSRSGVRP